MTNETSVNSGINKHEIESEGQAPHFDPHIIPAETAARIAREGGNFMHTPTKEDDQNQEVNQQAPDDTIDTTGGYTVDKEGLLNNYAVEPEMYYDVPGDRKAQKEAAAAERASELQNVNQDEDGKLTMEQDSRPKGPGLI